MTRAVIVTGGATGIGAAMVRAFAAQGDRVTFLDIDGPAGTALAAELGERVRFLNCDLLDLAALRAAIDTAGKGQGPAQVLVNNAARDQRQDFEEVGQDEYTWMMDVNFRHVFFACQAAVPQLRANGGGAIVNMSSVVWLNGGPEMPVYAAAKAAIVGLTNSLSRKLGPQNIRVNAIAPGLVITDRQRALWFQDEARIHELRARQAIPHAITPDDIARVALFLAGPDAAAITGQCLVVNAGLR
jgi:NAD(P)-dependent dehydrogenase (short-subunit alcohol dehydrogenase family)